MGLHPEGGRRLPLRRRPGRHPVRSGPWPRPRAGTLPSVGLITPNLINDAHDGTLAQADAWLRRWIPVIMSGPDWRHGRLAIAVVFDEGDPGLQVPFVLIAPGLSGAVTRQPLDHYALTRLIDQVIGAPPLRQAAGAPDLAQRLGLKVG